MWRWLSSARGAVRPFVLVSGGVAAGLVAVAVAIGGGGGSQPAGTFNLATFPGSDGSTCDSTPTPLTTPVAAASIPLSATGCTFGQTYSVARDNDKVYCKPAGYPAQTISFRSGIDGVQFIGPGTLDPDGNPSTSTRCVLADIAWGAANTTFDGIDIDGGAANATIAEMEGDADGSTWKRSSVADNVAKPMFMITANDITLQDMVIRDAVDIGAAETHMECIWAADVEGLLVDRVFMDNCAVFDLTFTWGDWWCGGVPANCPPKYDNITIQNSVFGCPRQQGGGYHSSGAAVHIGANTGVPGAGNANADLVNWDFYFNTLCNAGLEGISSRQMPSSDWIGNVGMVACQPGASYSWNAGITCGGANSVAISSTSVGGVPVFRTPFVNEPGGNFYLTPSTPAAGACSGAPNKPATYQDGTPRGNDCGALPVTS